MIRLLSGVSLACTFGLVLFGSSQVASFTPGGNSGTTGGTTGGNCASGSEGTYFDVCFGATWRYYKTDSDYVYQELPSNYNVKNDAVVGCGTWGGGYYRLGLERYNPRTFLSQNIEQVGFMQVRNMGFPYGVGSAVFRAPGTFNIGVDANGSIPEQWDTVRQNFEEAKQYAQKLREQGVEFDGNLADTDWEDAAWFCWKEGGFENGQARFLSNSTVEVPAQEGVSQAQRATAESNNSKTQSVKAMLTTENEVLTVNFWHNMFWQHEDENGEVLNDGENFDDVCTVYKVDQDGNKLVSDKKYCATGSQYQSSDKGSREKAVVSSSVPIKLQKGETQTVCQKISFDPERIKISDGESDGEGWSEACVVVTRIGDPEGEIWINGAPAVDVLYAGETATAGWNVSASATETLRILEWQAIAYQVPVGVSLRDDISQGSFGASGDIAPCDWFSDKVGGFRSGCISSEPVGHSERYGGLGRVGVVSYSTSRQVVLPDEVGDKYCVSFGFRWQKYVGLTNEDTGEIEYVKSGNQYWTNYGASCKTIAKKPLIAVWNGSVFAGGTTGINTSLANRYLVPKFGDTTESTTSERKKFGSWAEYLAVVGGNVDGFASGAALAFKGFDANIQLIAYSPLTIANTDSNQIGHSGINVSSAFKSRLESYLYGNAKIARYNDLATALSDKTNKVKVVGTDGVLPIDESIELLGDDEKYESIYDLPQLIIYAKNGINIGPNVTRIDAWLITDGVLNTCSGDGGQTEAYVEGYNKINEKPCAKSLIINGPVVAQNVLLHRTAGADPLSYRDVAGLGSGTDARTISAEVFNLSASTYLWAYAQAGRYSSSYTETYTRELPPRY